MSEQAFLELDRLTRVYAGTPAVYDLSLQVSEQEIVTLLGPSGCGKTTTLRIVAGFERPDFGRVVLSGRDVTHVAPQRRGFGMVFQHYALFPHLSVGANVAFGLEAIGLPRAEIEAKVARSLELVHLPGTEGRSVASLSGGQQQRIALARALAPEPQVLLLDEPLSNLDAALRERTRRELRVLVKEIGITTFYVTHDQEEAFDLSDRIAVMRDGRLEQLGPPEELYHRPATEFVATFLGRAGQVRGIATGNALGDVVECRLAERASWPALVPPNARVEPGAAVRVLARPEALAFAADDAEGALSGTLDEIRFAGSIYVHTVTVEGGQLEIHARSAQAGMGQRVAVRPLDPPRGLHAFVLSTVERS